LSRSIELIFQSRSYFLSDFPRWIAAFMLSYCSYQTSRFNAYFLVNPIDHALTVLPGALPDVALTPN
jgi:hypothetical protein